jgi:uncharacterized membrane protein
MENNYSNMFHVNSKTRDIVTSALLISLVFIFTRFINIRLPISINGGLIHTGNVMLFLSAIVFGRKKGAIAGAFGMGLFDIVSGWAAWSPFTFIIRGAMGYIVGTISYSRGKEGKSFWLNLAGILISSILMIAGYYLTEVILYGNWIAPVTSIPGNVIQLVVGAVFGLPAAAALKKVKLG